MTEKIVFLYTSCPKVLVEVAQNRLEQVLLAKKLTFTKIDGAIAENKIERDRLFSISNQRGEYPQCFIQNEDGTSTKFVGLWEAVSFSFIVIV